MNFELNVSTIAALVTAAVFLTVIIIFLIYFIRGLVLSTKQATAVLPTFGEPVEEEVFEQNESMFAGSGLDDLKDLAS